MCERSWERQQRKWRRQTVTKWENDRRQKPDVSDAGTLSTPGGSRCRSASTASRAVAGCDQQQDDTQEFSCSGGINLASTRAKKKRTALLITFDLLLILCCWWWTAASSVLKPPLPSHRSYFVMTLHPDKFFPPLPSVNTTWKNIFFFILPRTISSKLTSTTPIRLDSSFLQGWLRRVLSRSLLWQSWVCLSSHITSGGAGMSERL